MILEQVEIEQAISHYIDTKYFTLQGKHLEIEFMAGRNPPTVTANLDIVDDAVTGEPPKAKAVTTDDAKDALAPSDKADDDLPFG